MSSFTWEDYKKALLSLRPISDNHLKMLEAHYRAPSHTITMAALSKHMGYKGHQSANLQYGLFAKRVAEALGLSLDTQVTALALLEQPGPGIGQEHWRLIMLPRLVEALDNLKWFKP